jgi:RimJ/RimL family protein N-acetyltransferase
MPRREPKSVVPDATPLALPDAVTGPRYALAPLRETDELAALMVADQEAVRRFFVSETQVTAQEVTDYLMGCFFVFDVRTRLTQERAGAVFIPTYNPFSRQCFLSVFALEPYRGRRLFLEAVVLAIDTTFNRWGLQRIRFDVVDVNLVQFRSIEGWPGIDKEGVRKDWAFFHGAYRDAHLYSISRAGWALKGEGWARRFIARAEER